MANRKMEIEFAEGEYPICFDKEAMDELVTVIGFVIDNDPDCDREYLRGLRRHVLNRRKRLRRYYGTEEVDSSSKV